MLSLMDVEAHHFFRMLSCASGPVALKSKINEGFIDEIYFYTAVMA